MRLAQGPRCDRAELITAGVLILLFVAYQLWGTGIRRPRPRTGLEQRVRAAPRRTRPRPTTTDDRRPPRRPARPRRRHRRPAPPPPRRRPRARPSPASGSRPSASTGSWSRASPSPTSRRAPATTPRRRCPGQPGNAAIAGHRTTYGAPFNRLDELSRATRSLSPPCRARSPTRCSEQLIVSPDQVEVLDDNGDNRLTLTACHPKYSRPRSASSSWPPWWASPRPRAVAGPTPARARSRATARPAAATSARRRSTPPRSTAGCRGHQADPARDRLGVACRAYLDRRLAAGPAVAKWPAYLLGLPVFLIMLFFFFENFSRLLRPTSDRWEGAATLRWGPDRSRLRRNRARRRGDSLRQGRQLHELTRSRVAPRPDNTCFISTAHWDGTPVGPTMLPMVGVASTDALGEPPPSASDVGPTAPQTYPTAGNPTQQADPTCEYPGAGQQPTAPSTRMEWRRPRRRPAAAVTGVEAPAHGPHRRARRGGGRPGRRARVLPRTG